MWELNSMDKEKSLEKKLYVEPIENYRKRKRAIVYLMLPTIALIPLSILLDIYFIIHNIGESNFYISYICLPLGFIGVALLYYGNYKPLNRFIMYEDGFFERFTKKFIHFDEIKYIIIDHYRYQAACISVYYGNGGHECYSGIPEPEIKNIKKIYMQKGVLEKKKRTSIWE